MAAKNKYAAELEELRKQANEFLQEHYSLELKIPIEVNNRLSVTMGALVFYEDKPIVIEISGPVMKYGTKAAILDILKHELIHYALFILGKPYFDGQTYFENELKKHGVKSTEDGVIGKFLKFKCPECKEIGYSDKKRLMGNPEEYSTFCCDAIIEPISYVIFDGETETEYQEEPDEK